MKRMIASLIAAAVLLCGCGTTSQTSAPDAGIDLPQTSLRVLPFTEDADFLDAAMFPLGERILLYRGGLYDAPGQLGLYDAKTRKITAAAGEIPPSRQLIGAASSGSEITLLWQDTSEESISHILQTYDSTMHPLTEELCTNWQDELLYEWRRDTAGNEYAVGASGTWICRSGDAPQIVEREGDRLCMGKDASVWAVSGGTYLCRLDAEAMQAAKISLNDTTDDGKFFDGTGEHDLLYSTETALYGVSTEDNSLTALFPWAAVDLEHCVSCIALPDGSFAVQTVDYGTMTAHSWLLTDRTEKAQSEEVHLVMATPFITPDTKALVAKYNRQAEGVRIDLKEYAEEDGGDHDVIVERARQALTAELIAGNVQDLLVLDDMDYQALSNKGLFEDLSPYMESDPDFHEEDYMMNFLDAMRYRGRLERIAFTFYPVGFLAKTEYLDGKKALTMQELLEADLPEGMQPLWTNDNGTILFRTLYQYQLHNFVDYANGTCDFESPEFLRLLKLANTMPVNGEPVHDDYAMQENRAMLARFLPTTLQQYRSAKDVLFAGKAVTLIGIRAEGDGNGGMIFPGACIAMSSQTPYKEEIWDFIKFSMQAENEFTDGAYAEHRGWSLNKTAIRQEMASEMRENPAKDAPTYYMNGDYIEASLPVQEDADELMAFLEGITVCGFTSEYDQLSRIIEEEAGKYFAGDCTAESAAKAIQGRAEIYLAEQS